MGGGAGAAVGPVTQAQGFASVWEMGCLSGPLTLSLETFLPLSPPSTQTCLTRPSLAELMSLASQPYGNSSSSGGTSFSSMTGTAQAPLAPQSCSKVKAPWVVPVAQLDSSSFLRTPRRVSLSVPMPALPPIPVF